MPRYLYSCRVCDIRTIVEGSIQHPHQIPSCPKCFKGLVRVYDFAGVKFEGSGFYSVDKDKK